MVLPQQQRVFGARGVGLGRVLGHRGGAAVASAAAKGGSGPAGSVGRRGVMAQGLSLTATALVVAALTGGYVGWRGLGGGPQALAATLGQEGKGADGKNKKTSSLGFDLAMTQDQVNDAVKGLTDLQRKVTMSAGTERSFTGETVNGYAHDNKKDGVYVSAVGGLPLFDSSAKFDSGTGWPSFFAPIAPDHIIEKADNSIPFMPRVEVLDAKSGAHLGHVFNDGPRPTGKRYCMNAAAMKFIPREEFNQEEYKKTLSGASSE